MRRAHRTAGGVAPAALPALAPALLALGREHSHKLNPQEVQGTKFNQPPLLKQPPSPCISFRPRHRFRLCLLVLLLLLLLLQFLIRTALLLPFLELPGHQRLGVLFSSRFASTRAWNGLAAVLANAAAAAATS